VNHPCRKNARQLLRSESYRQPELLAKS